MPATIQDIGKALNLSHTTVSRVLNERNDHLISEATRDRVRRAARDMGYRPHRAARALATGRTHQVAVWMPHVSTAYDARVIRSLLIPMHEAGYQAVVGATSLHRAAMDGKSVPSDVSSDVDGTIIFEAMPYARLLLGREAEQGQMPLVGIGGVAYETSDLPYADYVGVDLRPGVEIALRHLVTAGFRRIALMGIPDPTGKEARVAAYNAVMAEAGRTPEIIALHNLSRANARRTLLDYVAHHGSPDALFCFNDDVALGAYRAARDLGLRIPEDLALIGHDGIEDTEYTDCPITTLVQPVEQMCIKAWEFLRRRIEDTSLPPQRTLLHSQLVVRASTPPLGLNGVSIQ